MNISEETTGCCPNGAKSESMEKKLKVPRQVKSQQVKDKIFQAAKELMGKHGYEYLTVANVCVAAGVSAGSFYHHFENKDQLMAYYFISGYQKFQKEFEAIDGPDFIENMVKIYDLHLAYCQEQDLGFMKNFYNSSNKGLCSTPGQDDVCAVNTPLINKSAEVLGNARDRGYLDESAVPKQLAFEVCILIKGCIFEWCLTDRRLPLLDQAGVMIRTYLRGLVTNKYKAPRAGK